MYQQSYLSRFVRDIFLYCVYIQIHKTVQKMKIALRIPPTSAMKITSAKVLNYMHCFDLVI